jgi:DNA-binding response OmpR family regulator
MIAATLAVEGFEVAVAHDGKDALSQIAGQIPDAILLDLQMPVMDGRVCYHKLREREIESPVLILSAYGAEEAREELGAEAAMGKPFDPDDLIAAVERLLAEG